ncbi:MAG: FAD binding domain-containing protein [Oscillibacter sp.]
MAQRNGKVWHADTILSLTEMQELKQIELAGDSLAVGAVCVHSQVAQSPLVRQYFPALAMACSQVGCAQIRNRGTLGGSIGTSSPAGDVYPPLLALCGAAEVMNSRGAVRTIPARELVLGKGKTALASDEAILRFLLPCPPNMRSARSARSVNGTRSRSPRSTSPSARLSKTAASRARACTRRGRAARLPFRRRRGVPWGKPLTAETGAALGDLLSSEVERVIAGRGSMPYKREAVRGLAQDVFARLIALAQERGL